MKNNEDGKENKGEIDISVNGIAGTSESGKSIIRDDFAEILSDFTLAIKRGEDSYKEDGSRSIRAISIYSDSTSGTICQTDKQGIPQIRTTGVEDDKRQRFFMGLQVEVSTLDWVMRNANLLTEKNRSPRIFGITNQCNELLEIAIKEAQNAGDKMQRKIDDENYEWFTVYSQPQTIESVNYDKEPEADLMLIKKSLNLARNTILNRIGSRIDELNISILKWTEHSLCATRDGAQVDQMIPRAGIVIYLKTKEGNEALGIIRGATGSFEEIVTRYENPSEEKNVEKTVMNLAEKVCREAIDLDRAQGINMVYGTDCPIVLAPGVTGVLIHEGYGHPSEGDLIAENRRLKGKNLVLKTRIGAQVSNNPDFNLIDTPEATLNLDGAMIRHNFGSLIVDGHGDKAQRIDIVENGVMSSAMVDRHCIEEIKAGLKPNIADKIKLGGSARVQNYTFPFQVRMRNTILLPNNSGPNSLAEMAALLPTNKKGLYVATCHGGWVNPDTGDFQIIAGLCYLIENGQITTKPLKNIKINGNIAKINVRAIGSAKTITETFTGYCGKNNQWVPVDGCGPIIWVENLTTAGVSMRGWSEVVNEYKKQSQQVFAGQKDSVYLPEVGEIIADKPQNNVCLVTAWLAPDKEAELIMGLDINPDYVIGADDKLKRQGDAHDV